MHLVDPNDEDPRGTSAEPTGGQPRASRRRKPPSPELSTTYQAMNDQIAGLRYSSTFNEYVCECGRKSCAEVVRLSVEEYRTIRTNRERLIIARGHAAPGMTVVGESDRYLLVERTEPT